METREWLLFSCRACRSMVKVPPAMAGIPVVCPTCRTKVTVPEDARHVSEEVTPGPSSLPSRQTEGKVRDGYEGWEKGRRNVGEKDSFLSKIGTSPSPAARPDVEPLPQVRVNMRKKKHEQLYSADGDPEAAVTEAAPRRGERRKRTKIRSTGTAFSILLQRTLFVFVILAAIAAAVVGYREWKKPAPGRSGLAAGSEEVETLERMAYSSYRKDLEMAVAKMRSVARIEDLLPLVRDRSRVEPAIRKYYDREHPWIPLPVNARVAPDQDPAAQGNYVVVGLELEAYKVIPVSFEWTGTEFLLDWESFVGYGELRWAQFTSQRPTKPTLMRTVVKVGPSTSYFDGIFQSTEWHCYQLTDRESEHFLYGYTKIGSEVDVQLQKAVFTALNAAAAQKESYAVMRVQYPPDAKNVRQVEITEYLENGWLIREDTPGVRPENLPPVKPEAPPAAPKTPAAGETVPPAVNKPAAP